jgi:Domain of unknown function (DUF4124)
MRKISRFIVKVSLLLCGFIISLSTTAEMYKWVDENGNTHYSQSPPNIDVDVEKIKPPAKIDTESAIKSLDKQKNAADKLRDDRISAKEEKQKTEEETTRKKEECQQARARLASYQRPRVNILNEDGSQRTILEEERQAEIRKSQDYVDKACN